MIPNSFKLKAEAAEQGSSKYKTLSHQGINYLYRCEWCTAIFVTAEFRAAAILEKRRIKIHIRRSRSLMRTPQ